MIKLQALIKVEKTIQKMQSPFSDMSDTVKEKRLGYSFVRDVELSISQLVQKLNELEGITFGSTQEIFLEMSQVIRKYAGKVRKLKKDEFATNKNLAGVVKSLYLILRDRIRQLNEGIELKEFAKTGLLKKPEMDVITTISKSFKSKNAISVLEEGVQQGDRLLQFKKNIKAPHVYLYGSDLNVEDCQIALDKGIDKVAKGGINSITPNCFDIVLFFQHQFTFKDVGEFSNPEVNEFKDFFRYKNPVKNGGYIIFNLPYYRVGQFQQRIMSFKVEGIYRTDDEAGNLIFICTSRKPDEVAQRQELRRAELRHSQLPHYSEMEEFLIHSKEVKVPEKFRGYVMDGRDHLHMFRNEQNPQSFIENIFEPVERSVELNEPLQEYKVGHLSAIASTGITNGIYDTHLHKDMIDGDKMHPHLLKTSLIRREVATMEEELKSGKMVPVISFKKTTELVVKTTTPDGITLSLLNQVEKNKILAEAKKKKDAAKKR